MYIIDSKHLYFLLYIGIVFACLIANHLNKQILPPYFRYFQYLFITIIIFEITGEILKQADLNNYFLDHLYQPLELTIFSLIYRSAIERASFKRLTTFIIIIFWCVAAFYSVIVEGLFDENRTSFFLGSFIVIFYSYRYIYQVYAEKPEQTSLLANPFFWIVTANLFYYNGIYFYMGLRNFIEDEETRKNLRIINMGLNYSLYVLYLIGFLCKKIPRFTS